jgi:hypothetical protein
MPARKVSQILSAESALRNLAAASRRVEQLQRIYLEAVPDHLSRASRVGWERAGVVSIVAGNGAVAAKLRQLAPRLLESFRRHGLQCNSMRIEVQVDAAAGRPPVEPAKPLSPRAAETLRAAARELPPSPLRTTLDRLSRRTR